MFKEPTNRTSRILQAFLVTFQLILTILQFSFVLVESQHYMIHHDFVIILFQYLLQKFLLLCIIIEDLRDNIELGSLRISGNRRAYLSYIITAISTFFLFLEAIGILVASIILRKQIVEDALEEIYKDIDDERDLEELKMKMKIVHDPVYKSDFPYSLNEEQIEYMLWGGLSVDVICLGIWMVLCINTFHTYWNWQNVKPQLEKMLGGEVDTGTKKLQQ